MIEIVRRAGALARSIRRTAVQGGGRVAGLEGTGGPRAARKAVCLFLIPSGFSRMRPSLLLAVFALTILASSANLVAPFLADQGPAFSLRKTLAGIAARMAAENETPEAPKRPDTPAPAWVAELFAQSDRTDLALAAGGDAAPGPPEVPTESQARASGPEPVETPDTQAADHSFTGVWAANERALAAAEEGRLPSDHHQRRGGLGRRDDLRFQVDKARRFRLRGLGRLLRSVQELAVPRPPHRRGRAADVEEPERVAHLRAMRAGQAQRTLHRSPPTAAEGLGRGSGTGGHLAGSIQGAGPGTCISLRVATLGLFPRESLLGRSKLISSMFSRTTDLSQYVRAYP